MQLIHISVISIIWTKLITSSAVYRLHLLHGTHPHRVLKMVDADVEAVHGTRMFLMGFHGDDNTGCN